jgi:hypothetical protein
MFVGKKDDLGTPALGQWTAERLTSINPHYFELDNWDHSTFSIGKDMSYFEKVL